MTSPLFVTAFFDAEVIGRTAFRATDVYLRLFEETHCALPFPLVVYADPKSAERIQRVVDGKYVGQLRVVSPLEVREIPRMNDLERLSKLTRMRNADGPKDTLAFAVLTWAKPWLVKRASEELSAFDRLAWIDFGLPHVTDPASVDWGAVEWKMPKHTVRVCEMRATSPREIEDLESFYSYNRGKIASAFFTAGKEPLGTLVTRFDEEIARMEKTGYCVNEEQIFGALTARHPELFSRWYSDYGGVLLNYTSIRKDLPTVLDDLSYCRENGMTARGVEIFDAVTSAMEARTLRLFADQQEEMARLLFDGQICLYYEDKARAREISRFIALLYTFGSRVIRQALERFRPQLDRNLAFFDVQLDAGMLGWEALAERTDFHAWSSAF